MKKLYNFLAKVLEISNDDTFDENQKEDRYWDAKDDEGLTYDTEFYVYAYGDAKYRELCELEFMVTDGVPFKVLEGTETLEYDGNRTLTHKVF